MRKEEVIRSIIVRLYEHVGSYPYKFFMHANDPVIYDVDVDVDGAFAIYDVPPDYRHSKLVDVGLKELERLDIVVAYGEYPNEATLLASPPDNEWYWTRVRWQIESVDMQGLIKLGESYGLLLKNGRLVEPDELKPEFQYPLVISEKSYVSAKGCLYFGKEIQIYGQKKDLSKKQNDTQQTRALRLLFKDVKSISEGVGFRQILSVAERDMDAKKLKNVKMALSEINQKVTTVVKKKNLIEWDDRKCWINKIYL